MIVSTHLLAAAYQQRCFVYLILINVFLRLRWLRHVQQMENDRRATKSTAVDTNGKEEKRNTKDDMERNNPETHQPDECDRDVG